MIDLEDIVEPEWLEWYRKTPQERFRESQKLFSDYRQMGGSLEPDVDSESPFWTPEDLRMFACSISESRGKAGLRMEERAGR
jgi:hypothetical protein